MQSARPAFPRLAALVACTLAFAPAVAAQQRAVRPTGDCMPPGGTVHELIGLDIPSAVRAEHAQLTTALNLACRAPGERGRSARALAAVLAPHFDVEENLAFPSLGLLAPLAANLPLAEFDVALARTDSLREALPALYREHLRLASAIARLDAAGRAAGDSSIGDLVAALRHHDALEEEVLLPAAVLVGEVVRARLPTVVGAPVRPARDSGGRMLPRP
ncbi:MAG TPA: hemerythrin domain-containing protein [Gemmatimonadales bacterium]|nr:hemerythrin domain-containing protein [Gemmatimonadales bacterium]